MLFIPAGVCAKMGEGEGGLTRCVPPMLNVRHTYGYGQDMEGDNMLSYASFLLLHGFEAAFVHAAQACCTFWCSISISISVKRDWSCSCSKLLSRYIGIYKILDLIL